MFDDQTSPPEEFVTDLRGVPVAVWQPSRPWSELVLVGHGGSRHKTDDAVTSLADDLVSAGVAVASIDGPVHGARRHDRGGDLRAVQQEWRSLWHRDPEIDAMIADWIEALDVVCERHPSIDRIGYVGLSMGCLYGIPLVAAAPDRFAVVVTGMWGSTNHTGPRLLADASRLTCPTLFYMRWHDQLFDRAGCLELFDAVGSQDKQLFVVPGDHGDPTTRERRQLTDFVVDRLRTIT
jgi:hypothetical protein